MVHTPEDFPDVASSYKVYSHLNQSSEISVSVSHIKADVSLRWVDEANRNCFLYERRSAREKNLPARKSNAEDNCYSMCRLRTTYRMCNCTPYYFDVEGTEWKMSTVGRRRSAKSPRRVFSFYRLRPFFQRTKRFVHRRLRGRKSTADTRSRYGSAAKYRRISNINRPRT